MSKRGTVVIYSFNSDKCRELDRQGNLFNIYSITTQRIPSDEKVDFNTGILLTIPPKVEVSFEDALDPILNTYVRNNYIYNENETDIQKEIIITIRNQSEKSIQIKEGTNIAKIRFSPLKNPTLKRV
jgi:dUTPase